MGNNRVPPSKANGIEKIEKPRSTIFADEAMLLTTKIETKKAETTSRYLNEDGLLFCRETDLFIKTPVFLRQVF
jgi:hypothetical protein